MYEDNAFANEFLASFENFVTENGYVMSEIMDDAEKYRQILESFWDKKVDGAKKKAA